MLFSGLAVLAVALGCYKGLASKEHAGRISDMDARAMEGARQLTGDATASNNYAIREMELKKGIERYWEEDYEDAVTHFDAALALRNSATVLSYKADAYCQMRQFGEAKKCCEEVLMKEPNMSKAHFTMGLIYKGLDQPEHALGCFRLAARNGEPKAGQEILRLEKLLRDPTARATVLTPPCVPSAR